MTALWELGEGSVRDIREALASSLPRAYTTIMTIMDRLAHKGVVERTKVGRAYVYRPNLSAQDARAHAVEQVVEHFFGGSAPALEALLSADLPVTRQPASRAAATVIERVAPPPPEHPVIAEPAAEPEVEPVSTRMDEVLL
jgi:predicted transcriptional regulator